MNFTLTIDGSLLKKTDVTNVLMIGPAYAMGVDEIHMDPGQKDVLTLSPDGSQLTYKSSSGESPTLFVDIATDQADYSFEVKGVDMVGGGTIGLTLDVPKGQLMLKTTGSQSLATYGLVGGTHRRPDRPVL